MAALIQKLFGRKKTPAPKPEESAGPTANQQEKVERQDELREHQLSRLSASAPQPELEALATQGVTADIRLSAARLLTAKESLQRVHKLAKGKDKGVYQATRQALQAIRATEEAQQEREQAIATLIQNARDQARSNDTNLYEPRLEALLKRWSVLENHATETQARDFLQAVHDCRARLDAMNAEKARETQTLEQQSQRAETLSLLKETLNNLRHPPDDSEPSVASLDALQKTQENRWLEATRDTSVDRQEQKAYESLMLPLRAYIAALKRFGQNREAIQARITQNAPSAPERKADPQPATEASEPTPAELMATIEWPAEFPMPPLLKQLAVMAGQKPSPKPEKTSETGSSAEQRALTEKVTDTLTRLEQALEAKQLKESRQLFRAAQQQFRQLDRRHSQPLQARMQLLGGQLRELTDWQGFATRPKQIALCEQMEYLAEQPMEPEAKAERIKEIQNEWRGLGGSSDRELWARFKQASDLAYEPCKEYFSAKSGLKQANLEARKTIIDQLKTFLDNADWQAIDWKAAERIHQKAREEWKAAWPIEFRDNRVIQKEFDALLKKLEQALNEEREKNEALKQGIVENAEALIDHEPLAEAMNRAKALQTEWQKLGITRHREDRKLWQAFRQACDQIFARRDAAKAEQQEQAQLDSLHASRRNSEKLEAWQGHIQARIKGPVDPSNLPAHWPELAEPLEAADAAELVIRAEILAQKPSPADEQSRRMEIQVRRLADGLGGNGQNQDPLAEMETLVAGWCLRPDDETLIKSRGDRLSAALEAAVKLQE